MSIKDWFKRKLNERKQKMLDSSDTYNYHKDTQERHDNEIKDIQKELKRLNKVKKSFDKKFDGQDEVLDSYNKLFNVLYIDYDLKPKGVLKDTQDLCIELLDFVVNICKKYGLEYWLDYGNLIGAVRHEGFIPWDDDIDIGMMRKDYNRFLEVIDDEIKKYGLEEYISVHTHDYDEKRAIMFIQLKMIDYGEEYVALYAGLDIFPYDFVKSVDDDTYKKFKKLQPAFRRKLLKGLSLEEILEEYFDVMGVTTEKQEKIIPALENTRGPSGIYDFGIIDTDYVFPLKEIKFGDKYYSCPNNCDEYLQIVYGEYSTIHKVVHVHKRVDYLKTFEDVNEKFNNLLEILKEVNDKYE